MTKLTLGQAHAVMAGLAALENIPDIKLDGATRLSIAINVNRLKPSVEAYERARLKTAAGLYAANRKPDGSTIRSEAEVQCDALEQDAAARVQETDDMPLKTIAKGDLKLSENPKITGAIIAQLMPILTDIDV